MSRYLSSYYEADVDKETGELFCFMRRPVLNFENGEFKLNLLLDLIKAAQEEYRHEKKKLEDSAPNLTAFFKKHYLDPATEEALKDYRKEGDAFIAELRENIERIEAHPVLVADSK
jgi:hypothetical protein